MNRPDEGLTRLVMAVKTLVADARVVLRGKMMKRKPEGEKQGNDDARDQGKPIDTQRETSLPARFRKRMFQFCVVYLVYGSLVND
jgi:hypothetical protein